MSNLNNYPPTLKDVFGNNEEKTRIFYELLTDPNFSCNKKALSKKLNIQINRVYREFESLQNEGSILTKSDQKTKDEEYILLSPDAIYFAHWAKSLKKFQQFDQFKESTLKDRQKLMGIWKQNKKSPQHYSTREIFDINAPLQIMLAFFWDMILAFESELIGKDIVFLTYGMKIVKEEPTKELLSHAIDKVQCRCKFIGTQSSVKHFKAFMEKNPKMQNLVKFIQISPDLHLTDLKIVLLGDVLGVIALKRKQDYVGRLYLRDTLEIRNYLNRLESETKK